MSQPISDAPHGQEITSDLESALLLLVPAAEPVVGEHRARFDASARDGVPAHLTVLYPFLPPALIDDTVLASLIALFAGYPAFGSRWTGSAGSTTALYGLARATRRRSGH
jgi:hypothetical protein